MKKGFLLSALTCGLLLGTVTLQAKTDKKALVQNVIDQQVKAHKTAPKEIILGMQNTFRAFQALDKGKKDEAKKYLEQATQSFDKALKKNPALDLIPVDERFQAYIFNGSAKDIAARIHIARELLEAHDTQVAIDALTPLKDELDITTVSIPMKLYPLATQKALNALNKGDTQEAIRTVTAAMNSLVVVKAVLPTPLLVTQDLVIAASKLDKNMKTEADTLLQLAKEELKRAELLGYTGEHSKAYKALTKSIEAIQKEIKGKNVVVKLYDTLKNDFKHIIENTSIAKVSKDRYQDSIVKKEAKALKNPSAVKDEAAAKAKVEETEMKDQFETKEKTDAFKKEAVSDKKKTIQ